MNLTGGKMKWKRTRYLLWLELILLTVTAGIAMLLVHALFL